MGITLLPIKFNNKKLLQELIQKLNWDFSPVEVLDVDIDIDDLKDINRNQYLSTQIIERIIKKGLTTKENVVILTEVDIFIPPLTFVFGEAQLNGKYSIISVFRLYEDFYSGQEDYKLLLDRLYKEIVHELGHNSGLWHCMDWNCIMHSANNVEEADIRTNWYCNDCVDIINKNGFVMQRKNFT